MVGVESKYFFNWDDQYGGDVLGWKSESLGAAYIVGKQHVIMKPFSSEFYFIDSNTTANPFHSGDCTVMEVDLTETHRNNEKEIMRLEELFEKEKKRTLQTSNFKNYSARIRFTLVDCKLGTKLIGDWVRFGNSLVTYVPAVSVNLGLTNSFNLRYRNCRYFLFKSIRLYFTTINYFTISHKLFTNSSKFI